MSLYDLSVFDDKAELYMMMEVIHALTKLWIEFIETVDGLRFA